MKHSIIIAGSILFATLSGCTRTDLDEFPPEGGLRITVDCGEIGTRTPGTPRDGVGNENLIRTIDCFLFLNPAAGDPAPTYSCKKHIDLDAGVSSNYTFYIHKSDDVVDGTYTVFTVVNWPDGLAELGASPCTLSALEEVVLAESSSASTFTSNFSTESGKSVASSAGDGLSLVMTGKATNVAVSTPSLSGTSSLAGTATVSLERLAAKVTLEFNIRDEVHATPHPLVSETWTPLTDGSNIRVYLCNGKANVRLDGGSPATALLFDYEPSLKNTPAAGKDGFSTAFLSEAFYTYPEEWDYGDAEEPYLKLIIPWKVVRTEGDMTMTSQKEFYYKVMFPVDGFERNTWYHMTLDINQIGSDTEDAAVIVKPVEYSVADWGTLGIESNLTPGYYLEVNEGRPTLDFYSDVVEIPYFASGEVELTVISVTRKVFYDPETPNTIRTENVTGDFVKLDSKNELVRISHKLRHDYTSDDYDVSQYIYTFKLHLKDAGLDESYDKTVTVTQSPPLYIKEALSDGKVFVYTRDYAGNSSTTYTSKSLFDKTETVGNSVDVNNKDHYLGTVVNPDNFGVSTDNPSSKNPYIFEINATILHDFYVDTSYGTILAEIGDSRSKTAESFGDNFNGNYNNTNQTLSNYYPAADDTQDIVSPEFRIASSYGKTTSLTYEGAKRRCASYQENGYPAGRWRLPTIAEIEFLIKLNQDHKIDELFNADATSAYWAGGGQAIFIVAGAPLRVDMRSGYTSNPTGNSTGAPSYTATSASVYPYDTSTTLRVYARCVYDTWYWGEEQYSGYTNNNWLGFPTTL